MRGYLVEMTCPKCGGSVEHRGSEVKMGREGRGVVFCCVCEREFVVLVALVDA